MQWFGKGRRRDHRAWSAGGPIGSVARRASRPSARRGQRALRRSSSPQQISQLFFEVAFEVMGQVAKIDGRVSEDEVRVARGIMHGMRLSPEQVRNAIDHFTRGKSGEYPLDARLAQLGRSSATAGSSARAFVQIQLQSAIGAGPIGPEKRQLLWRVASALA